MKTNFPSARSFNKEYFDSIYRHYQAQNPPYKMAFYESLVRKWSPLSGHRRILDIGCAFGKFLGHLDPSWTRYGVDISQYAIETAQHTVPGVTFAQGDCTDIPFKGPFDAIVSFDVVEHIPDLASVASYVNGNLAPDGVFVFVVPVYDGPFGWLVRLLDPDPTHVHKEGRGFWLSWASNNFRLEDWNGIFRYLLPWGPYINWPTRLFRGQAPAIALVVRRAASVASK